MHIGKEDIKLSFFADDIIVKVLENLKESIKEKNFLELISNYNKFGIKD